MTANNRMELDIITRYTRENAANARPYVHSLIRKQA